MGTELPHEVPAKICLSKNYFNSTTPIINHMTGKGTAS